MKQIVNDALRDGMARLNIPAHPQQLRTNSVDLGICYFPDLDNVWEVLDEVEQPGSGR